MLAPFDDVAWDIWATSPRNMGVFPRVDAWFEIHTPIAAWPGLQDDYLDYIKTLTLVYMRDIEAGIPGAVVYPEEAMVAEFGPFFFTSTIAYMMALAISRQPTHIGLWGIHMASHEEYEDQRPGCHHFAQVARDRGIEVTASEWSTVLSPPPPYGLLPSNKEQAHG